MSEKLPVSERIKSLRESLGKQFVKPDPKKLDVFIEALHNSQAAQDYLHDVRGLTDDTISHFKLGYNPEFNAIAIPSYKDGELINIKYRLIEPKNNKYLGEAGAETWLFNEDGIEEGKSKKAVLIVEGEFDLMAVWQSGIKNVVSPSFGKDSYGVWIERLDPIARVYVAYDNDAGGKETSIKLAERLGFEKCFQVQYPDGFKDANDYLLQHSADEFKKLVRDAKPFYTYKFKGLGEIITSLRKGEGDLIKLSFIPSVKIDRDWLIVLSARSNIGKTSYAMNIADELTRQQIPVLVMPFERGIENVGKRFMQVKFDKTSEEFADLSEKQWEEVIDQSIDTPIYFSMPKKDDIVETIVKSKRLFNTRFVIIDHLDYVVRHTMGNKEAEIGNTLQTLKRVAEENGLVILIVTHIRKIDSAGAETLRKPNIEDLKGSASLYQDPECVVLLHSDNAEQIEVNVVKNKGEMKSKIFDFRPSSGKLYDNHNEF